jgi:H/ACA ribonucleoprotein complex subunit 2
LAELDDKEVTMEIDEGTNQLEADNETKKAKATTAANIVVPTYEERCEAVNVISHPLASKKSTKKVHKLVKKAASSKQIRRGVKEVVKAIRKNEKGLAILAGDIYPIDVISHIPILLEEHNIPYIFVPSKFDLGAAASTKRPTSCVLVRATAKDVKTFDGQELYDTIIKEAMEYDPTKI